MTRQPSEEGILVASWLAQQFFGGHRRAVWVGGKPDQQTGRDQDVVRHPVGYEHGVVQGCPDLGYPVTDFRRARQLSAHTVHLLFVRERGIRSEYAELLPPRRVPRRGAA